MSLYPATIRPAVSAETIGKVTRMFNGTIDDIVAELFQNARRTGAGRIEVTVDADRSPAWAFIRDDGQGIANPASFVTLGQSGWDRHVRVSEDPAGMGVFSLAGTAVVVTSRASGTQAGWNATIAPDAWTGEMDIAVSVAEHPVGTTIAFELTKDWLIDLMSAVARQARYLPIPVTYRGAACARHDWLEGAFHRALWNGCTIGVVMGHRGSDPAINFHGLTVKVAVASVEEVRGRTFTAIVDMGPSNDIQLVLPARKEVVQNAAWTALREAAERVIYEAIATLPFHTLAFSKWRRAAELGVSLPEARPGLRRWRPRTAEGYCGDDFGLEPLAADGAVLMPSLHPETANPFDRALRGDLLRNRLAELEKHYVGYSWYDDLPFVDEIVFSVSAKDGDFSIIDGRAEPEPAAHVMAETITLGFTLDGAEGRVSYQRPSDVALFGGEDSWGSLDEATIIWRACEGLSPSDVVGMLENAYFCASEDHDDDSIETQRDRFCSEAFDLVLGLMRGPEEALCDQFRRALDNLTYLIPAGKQIEATITRDGAEVRLIEVATGTA